MTLHHLTAALTLSLAALPALANPVSTRPGIINPALGILLRDSDGIVISVIHPPIYWIPLSGGPASGGIVSGGIVPGGVFYSFGGVEMAAGGVGMSAGGVQNTAGVVQTATGGVQLANMSSPGRTSGATTGLPTTPVVLGGADLATPSANGTTVTIGGTTYRVETAGGKVWLRDEATGVRYATARHIAPMTPDAVGMTVNPTAFALD